MAFGATVVTLWLISSRVLPGGTPSHRPQDPDDAGWSKAERSEVRRTMTVW